MLRNLFEFTYKKSVINLHKIDWFIILLANFNEIDGALKIAEITTKINDILKV